MIPERFSSAGLAQTAAELATQETGRVHKVAFRPRFHPDPQPFIIEESSDDTEPR